MRLPLLRTLFRKETTAAARRERVEAIEKVLTTSLRQLATFASRIADTVEKRRLARAGYEPQGQFLERTDGKK